MVRSKTDSKVAARIADDVAKGPIDFNAGPTEPVKRETRLERLQRELREEQEREVLRAHKQLEVKHEELTRAENNIAKWEEIRDKRKAEIRELESIIGVDDESPAEADATLDFDEVDAGTDWEQFQESLVEPEPESVEI